MNFFRNISIKKKLTWIILLVSSLALLTACLTFITYDLINFKNSMLSDLEILAEIIGTNSSAAIVFDSEIDAKETLAALKAQNHITSACIYTIDGKVFAEYFQSDKSNLVLPSEPKRDHHEFTSDYVILFREIVLDGEKIGTVYIQSDLQEMYARIKRYAVIIAVVLLLSSAAVFPLTSKLQRVISEPILHLAQKAKIVSEKKDFSVRAEKFSHDELGYLTERFNEMLKQIQDRDNALQTAHGTLEKQALKLKKELAARTRFEQALRKSEERFRDLFDNAPDMYIILDPQGTIVDFNQRGLSHLGYAIDELVGKPVVNFIHPGDIMKAEKVVKTIHKTGQPPKNIEVRLISKKRKVMWVSKEFSLFKDDAGQIQAIRVVCRDITERRHLQNELERAQRLESAGRIAGQIAHDFNNLLGPLAAYPVLIREELPFKHPVQEMVDEMETSANKIAEINQQLLALGRRGHYLMEPIDLNDLIKNVLNSQPLSKKIKVIMELYPELFLIKGGAAQLTRALINLIINAEEAILNTGRLTIKTENIYLDEPLHGIQSVKRGEYVHLKISDTGSGIKPEVLDKIFDPFFTTKTMDRMRGSGLGLSVVHGIVEDHKGYITVHSEVGKGTTFSLYFPISRDVQNEISETIEKIEGGEDKILIIDDDPVQRRVTSHLLKRLGYEVHTLTSGEQAVDFVNQNPQDLLILDMVMDGMDGTETYKQILEFQPNQKALILSGYAMSQRVEEALRLGAGGFVSKPISLNALAIAVRKELDKIQK